MGASIGDEVADVPSDLKNSNVIVVVAIVGVVDHSFGRNEAACLIFDDMMKLTNGFHWICSRY